MMRYESWGRYPKARHRVIRVADRHQPVSFQAGLRYLPFGNGRSYGDVCLNDGGILLATRGLDKFIAFDADRGEIACEAGVLLADVLEVAVPRGWFLPVTPGTKYVTVGGAIANDVHGKNHHARGTFGAHVLSFELLRSDGTRLDCSPSENVEWFSATIGGLGLTGLILQARLRLIRIASPMLTGEAIKFGGLDDFFALSTESDATFEYTASWVDCLASGSALGRGHFIRANHASEGTPLRDHRRFSLPVPVTPPFSLANPLTLRPFNSAYYHRQARERVATQWHYEPFLYPLDTIANWNRLYGPRGFLQYQCVVPKADQRDVSRTLFQEISRSGEGSFLAVFKAFGEQPSPGLLSFPRSGAALALDFPNRGEKTFALLDRLDAIVCEAGGRVYPAKDARMSAEMFKKGYPRLERFRNYIDPSFSSSFERRVMMRLA